MNREMWQILCMLASIILMIIGFGNFNKSQIHTYRLALTGEGCEYSKSVRLAVEQLNGICSASVRFLPDQTGGGGTIVLETDQQITISSSMLLASQQVAIDLPKTAEQSWHKSWGVFWLTLALSLLGYSLYIERRHRIMKRHKKTK